MPEKLIRIQLVSRLCPCALATILLVALSSPLSPAGAEELAVPALCPAPPSTVLQPGIPQPVPAGPCSSCSTAPFSPGWGILCTFAGTCTHGQGACCNYSCACGVTSSNRTTPADACELDLPGDCCPGFPNFCQVSFCDAVGVRCINDGCGVGCCSYSCGPDSSCSVAEPATANIC